MAEKRLVATDPPSGSAGFGGSFDSGASPDRRASGKCATFAIIEKVVQFRYLKCSKDDNREVVNEKLNPESLIEGSLPW